MRQPNLSPRYEGFAYQAEALLTLRDLPYSAVFHEQGLGKTKIGVDLALFWLQKDLVDSVVIVTKRGLVENWRQEIKRHTFLEPRILGQDRKKNFIAFNSPVRLYLTHYEVMKSELKRLQLFQKTRRVAVLLDEAHKIKNPDAALTVALFKLAEGFARKVIMTGTPVANRPFDIWAPIFFLDQGRALGKDFKEFKSDLDLSNNLASSRQMQERFEEKLETIFDKIKDFAIRKTKATAGIELPKKVFYQESCNLAPRQRELYESFRRDFKAYVRQSGVKVEDDAEDILKRLLRLVQVASNPRLVDEDYIEVPGKFLVLKALVDEIRAGKEKVLIWSSFTENVDWLHQQLRQHSPVKVHGKMTIDARTNSIKRFMEEDDCGLFIATPAAAKEGLTLTVDNHAIFFDRSFSLDYYLQAQDRIHRISQQKTCTVRNLVAKETVDEWVEVLLNAKALAAQMAQGDISREYYRAEANYAFGDMIRDILREG